MCCSCLQPISLQWVSKAISFLLVHLHKSKSTVHSALGACSKQETSWPLGTCQSEGTIVPSQTTSHQSHSSCGQWPLPHQQALSISEVRNPVSYPCFLSFPFPFSFHFPFPFPSIFSFKQSYMSIWDIKWTIKSECIYKEGKVYLVIVRKKTVIHKIIELSRLEKTSKIISSNHQSYLLSAIMKQCPLVSCLFIS